MATHTTNYNLSKPESTDTQQSHISAYCNNMDIIDQNLGGGHTIVDENGSDMPQEDALQFTGNVSVTDDNVNGKTIVDVTGVSDVEVNGASVVNSGVAEIKSYKEVTKAEYDALPNTKFTDGVMYCLKDAPSGGGGGFYHEYSETEHEVGKWIDGSPVYERTYQGTTSSNTQHNISNLSAIISVECIAYGGSSGWRPVPYSYGNNNSGSWCCGVYVDNTSIVMQSGTSFASYFPKTYVTIQYTKSS